MRRVQKHATNNGFVLIFVLVTLAVAMAFFVAVTRSALTVRQTIDLQLRQTQADCLATSALSRAVAKRALDAKYTDETWRLSPADMGGRDGAVVHIHVAEGSDKNSTVVNVDADYPDDPFNRASISRIQTSRQQRIEKMKLRHKNGFTLVELLVVIAIISILIGLMMPGIQGLREAARRSQCQQRLAKLGFALQRYQSAEDTLPSGTTDSVGPIHNVAKGSHIARTVRLLPYLDERSTFKQIDLAAGVYSPKNAAVHNLLIAALVCPSDHAAFGDDPPASSYAGCHNDVEAPIDEKNMGVLFLNSHVADRDVTDGLEHTIFVGEKKTVPGELGWMSGTRATLRNMGTPMNQTQEDPPASDLIVGGFGSNHPTGGNFLFGDSAFRFVNNEIDMQVYQQLGNRADGKLLTSGPTREH